MNRPTIEAGRAARIVLVALAAGIMALSFPAFRSQRPVVSGIAPVAVRQTNTTVSACDLRHPIEAHLTPLDPIARGGIVRVALDVESTVPLSNAGARIISTGGAALVGRQRAELGTLEAGDARRTEFTLRLPRTGKRFVLQILITGEAATGPMNRLAMLNILPDGPADPGQVTTTPAGESIRQYASSARRIER